MPRLLPRTKVVSFQYEYQLPKGVVIDYQAMWQKQIIKKTETILRGLGVTFKDVMSGITRNALDGWKKK